MSRNLLRVGIAGCGMVAQTWHIPAFLAEKSAIIVAVCDMNEKLAASVARKYGINRCYSDVSDMLEHERLDILDTCVPTSQHAAVAIQGMEGGCHILVEKPIAATCSQADDMIRAADRHHRKICVVHNRLFHPVVMRAMSMVSKGELGRFTSVDIKDGPRHDHPRVMDSNHWSHKLPAGILSEILPHPLYLAERLIGSFQCIEIFTKKTRPEGWLLADEARILIEGERGIANIAVSLNSPKNTNTIDIFGTMRQLHVDVYNSLLIVQNTGSESRVWRALDNVNKAYQHLACTVSVAAQAMVGRYHVSHAALIRQFVQSIVHGTESPVSAQEGKELLRNLERVEEKIRRSLKLA